jgi:hypothetical protein
MKGPGKEYYYLNDEWNYFGYLNPSNLYIKTMNTSEANTFLFRLSISAVGYIAHHPLLSLRDVVISVAL